MKNLIYFGASEVDVVQRTIQNYEFIVFFKIISKQNSSRLEFQNDVILFTCTQENLDLYNKAMSLT